MKNYTAFLLLLVVFPCIIYTLPIQTVLYQEELESLKYEKGSNMKDWYKLNEEYDIYQTTVEHYEGIVDLILSTESEDLLYNLLHLPKESLNEILHLQAELIGVDILSENQLQKMPSIIGKHIEKMNKSMYLLTEISVTVLWNSLWHSDMIKEKEKLLSFLSSVNTFVAKNLIEAMTDYQLLEQIKQDLDEEYTTSGFSHHRNPILKTDTTTSSIEIDFLRQYLCDVRSNLLTELDVQFMGFFSTLQQDLIDQSLLK